MPKFSLDLPIREQRARFLELCGDLMGSDPAGLFERTRAEEVYVGPDRTDPMTVPAIRDWYRGLDAGRPDLDAVYASPRAVAHGWVCWEESRPYVRKYLRAVPVPPRSLVDAGAGLGLFAASLARYKVRARATNAPGCVHRTAAERLLAEMRSKVRFVEPGEEGRAELLAALEYLEHFPAPVRELGRLLDRVRPRGVLLANSFGVLSAGHYRTFEVPGNPAASAREASRAVSTLLRDAGFRRLPIQAWNGKPQLWGRD